jgi:hypothetical protein
MIRILRTTRSVSAACVLLSPLNLGCPNAKALGHIGALRRGRVRRIRLRTALTGRRDQRARCLAFHARLAELALQAENADRVGIRRAALAARLWTVTGGLTSAGRRAGFGCDSGL